MKTARASEKARPDRSGVTASSAGKFGSGKSSHVYVVSSAKKQPKRFAEIFVKWRHAGKLRSDRELVSCFQVAEPRSIWLSPDAKSLRALTEKLSGGRGEHRVLVFESIADSTRQVLSAYFRHVLTVRDSLFLLDPPELIDVLSSEDKQDLFIGGTVDAKDQAVVLYRGSLDPLVVPLAWFSAGKHSPPADPTKFAVEDSGQTVRLGDFEAATDAILYEFDREYRARSRKHAIETDDSFGASLRRLRLQKGLSREDFNGVAAKTIARIERNEIQKPHEETLAIVADRLGVSREALGTF